MCSLEQFPSIPQPGFVNVCESEGRIQSVSYENAGSCESYASVISQHPNVRIPRETGPTGKCDISAVFAPSSDTLANQVVTTCYEKGILSALALLQSNQAPAFLRKTVGVLFYILDAWGRVINRFQPLLKENGENLISVVSQCQDWAMSPVRCLDWHPNYSKLAVGVSNDCVRIYTVESSLVPVLKSQQQSGISCLAWRPFSASELAVGCQNGTFLWTIDPSSVIARPSSSCARHLHRPGHTPVTSLAWAPDGDLLVTSSAADSTMYVWSPEFDSNVPLYRMGGGGVCLVQWAPKGNKIFASTAGVIFRVWDTCGKWNAERWNTRGGRVQSACWSPCGTTLLFATTTEPLVYCLRLVDVSATFGGDDGVCAKPVIDLTPMEVSEDGERAGGLVVGMTWDQTGHYVAVICRDSNLVTLFRTSLGVIFTITPCCHINGLPGEIPSTVAFQKNFEDGTVLTIAWSSGRLQHFPILCYELDDCSQSKNRTLSDTRLTNMTSSRFF